MLIEWVHPRGAREPRLTRDSRLFSWVVIRSELQQRLISWSWREQNSFARDRESLFCIWFSYFFCSATLTILDFPWHICFGLNRTSVCLFDVSTLGNFRNFTFSCRFPKPKTEFLIFYLPIIRRLRADFPFGHHTAWELCKCFLYLCAFASSTSSVMNFSSVPRILGQTL